jgi:hypothetical protein
MEITMLLLVKAIQFACMVMIFVQGQQVRIVRKRFNPGKSSE